MPSFVVIWLWLCAYFNCVGWVLSWLHQLNTAGYLAAFALGLAIWFGWSRANAVPLLPRFNGQKLRRRFRRGFPLAFLVLAALAFLGGALHPANNYDTLAYRTPRVLHWLAEGQWHWIHTEFQRLNTRTAGFEWLTAPQFLFLHTDRLIFLFNVITFLLLPGRVFSVLTQLGVRARAAWYWMWLLPSGYGYVLQAGSVVNDMFGAMMALAAIEFALRARRETGVCNVWASCLAAALMTAAKAFNILLLLPWALAIMPAVKNNLRRPLASMVVLVFAISASMTPTAFLNWKSCGDWTGLKAEQPMLGGGGLLRLLANAINLPLAQVSPPIFPLRPQWDRLVQLVVPAELSHRMHAVMEKGQAEFRIPELQTEESAGLGLGVTCFVLVLLVQKIRAREFLPGPLFSAETLVPLAAWAGVGVFMVQVGVSGSARYLLPFYPLLIAPVLAGKYAGIPFQQPLWRNLGLAAFVICVLLLVLSPPRPLWPAKTVLRALRAEDSPNPLLARAWNVYDAYDLRSEGLTPTLAALPPEVSVLGYLACDEPETSLWRPFGSRRIKHICLHDTPADLRARGVGFGLVSEDFLRQHEEKPADWLARMHAVTVQRFELKLLAREQPHHWQLVKFVE